MTRSVSPKERGMRHDNTSRERGREHRVRDKEYSSTRMNDRHDSPEGTHGYSSPDNYEHDIAHDSKDSSPAKRVLLGELRGDYGSRSPAKRSPRHHRQRKEGVDMQMVERLQEENQELREMLIQNGLFMRITAGMSALGMTPPQDMRDATLEAEAARCRSVVEAQIPQAGTTAAVWAERAGRADDEERRTHTCLQELRSASKELYKSMCRTRLVSVGEQQMRVKKAEAAAARACRLADKLLSERRPLEFLARFVAFQQAMASLHEMESEFHAAAEASAGARALDRLVLDDCDALRGLEARTLLGRATPRGRTLAALARLLDQLSLDQGVTPNAPAPLTGDVQGVASTLATPDPPQGSELAAAEGAYLKGPRAAHAFAKTVMKLQSDKVDDVALVSEILTHSTQPRKKALIIGINYERTDAQLQGCIRDAHANKSMLVTRFGFPDSPESVRLLTDEPANPPGALPTAHNIRKGLRWLVEEACPGDHLVFMFSGHASQVADYEGDEEDGRDECLCPLDMITTSSERYIPDDELRSTLFGVVPEGVVLTAFFDCSHGGTVASLQAAKAAADEDTEGARPPRPPPILNTKHGEESQMQVAERFHPPASDVTARMEELMEKRSLAGGVAAGRVPGEQRCKAIAEVLRKNLVVITGCRDNQTAADAAIDNGKSMGAATWALHKVLSEDFRDTPYPMVTEMIPKMNDALQSVGLEQTVQLQIGEPLKLAGCRFLS